MVNEGTVDEFLAKSSPTSVFLNGEDEIAVPMARREPRSANPLEHPPTNGEAKGVKITVKKSVRRKKVVK